MNINWPELWRELIVADRHTPNSEPINRYKTHAYQRRQRPDPLLDFVLQSIDSKMTVLDIGAGNGRWTIPLARRAKTVTAIEPDGEMLDLLRENIKTVPGNIQIIHSSWEDAKVGIHDIVVCAHAMYSSPDLTLFVRKMEKHASQTCYLAMRLPPVDGVLGELSSAIYGRLYDSANAVIAYNALYSLGIYANVFVENDIRHWVNNTLEEAILRAKRHLHLESTNTHDGLIRDTLYKRLTLSNDGYVWPDGMRSALLWWNPSSVAK
jgi:2-polyprenyl-3-methyl-5-hydroxy-6-metoxy-1,4-benzoquinol methylase